LIVLDLMMPEVDGFAVVEALRKQPDAARIPILVLSAKEITPEDRAQLKGHVAAIIGKTDFDQVRFTAEVRRAMSNDSWWPDMATVLIVEDNPTNMQLATFVVESVGHSVLTATNAEAGLTLAREQRPALTSWTFSCRASTGSRPSCC
jgi:CheY-like chemotaxis protein